MLNKINILFLNSTYFVFGQAKHGKNYESQEEEKKRYGFFQDNLKVIEEHNKKFDAGEFTYSMGINQFTDLGPGEDPCGHHHHHQCNLLFIIVLSNNIVFVYC